MNQRQMSLRSNLLKLRSTMKTVETFDMLAACEVPNVFTTPSEDDVSSWLAENTVEFFNEGYLNYSMATNDNKEWTDICKNPKKHPTRGFPEGLRFLWKDEQEKAQTIPADEYVSNLFLWIENEIDNEDTFPPDEDTPFPANFNSHLQKIFRRLIRIYVIIFSNKCLLEKMEYKIFKRSMTFFLYFSWRWELLSFADLKEAKPMEKLVGPIREAYKKDVARRDTSKKGSLKAVNIEAMKNV